MQFRCNVFMLYVKHIVSKLYSCTFSNDKLPESKLNLYMYDSLCYELLQNIIGLDANYSKNDKEVRNKKIMISGICKIQ